MGAVGGFPHNIAYVSLSIQERQVPPLQAHILYKYNPSASDHHNIQKVIRKEAGNMGYLGGAGVGCGSCAGLGLGTSTGVILVLFILLVIISRTFI
jgi:hypothetical protein